MESHQLHFSTQLFHENFKLFVPYTDRRKMHC